MFTERASIVCRTMHEATCIFNGTQPCTRDANSASTSYDTDDNSFSRVRVCRASAEKKGSPTRDTSPVHSRISRTKVDLLRKIFFLVSPWLVSIYNLKTLSYVRDSLSCAGKEETRYPIPLYPPRKVLREKPHISRPANLKILKSTFPAARVMAPDDC